jgi:acyl phosphate:glycerol-3-phosphate acyltransferase
MNPLIWLILTAAYLLGGVSPGYWLVRLKTGEDVRKQGSGATGATNSARLLGRGGFALVLALDALKGAVAVLVARAAGMSHGWEFAAGTAVVTGHVWPVLLGFRGGRGLGPLLGAWLVLAPLAIGACIIIAGITWAISKHRVYSGLFGTLLLPVATWWDTRNTPATIFTAIAFCVIAFAHRSHFTSSSASAGTS